MSKRYTKDHEWVRLDGDVATIGISQYATEQLGDVVYVELPAAGADYAKGADMAVVERAKAASDVYAPIAGEVIEGNAKLADAPETLNQDPYGAGWMWKLKPANAGDVDKLLDAAGYQKVIDESK